MNQNVFCQRNVFLVPEIRIAVIHKIITMPPAKIQPLSVWIVGARRDQRVAVEDRSERDEHGADGEHREVPRPEGRADHRRERAPRFETIAAGGDRIRLTQT